MDVFPPKSSNLLTLLLISFFLQPFLSSAISPYPPAKLDHYDRQVLLRIQKQFGGPSSGFWNSSDPYCCVYCYDEPVICNPDGHVERLYLMSNANLSGTIPSAIADLTYLVDLSIVGTGFKGQIPTAFGKMINLQYLTIDNTHVCGKIPRCLGRLKNLNMLQLSHNRFYGQIPNTLGNLTNVFLLDLSFNMLSGTISDFLLNMTSLGDLNLGSNRLYGPIPEFLGRTRLGTIDLSSNRLSGPIPDSIGNLNELEHLIFHSNNLSGPIPKFVGLMVFAKSISLHSNQLSGEIPEGTWSSFDQFSLYLNNNQLTGSVPLSLARASFFDLDLSSNKLTDASNLFNTDTQGYCDHLDLSNNLLKFDFSHASFPPGQYFLNISHNMIYGSFPKLLAKMPEGSTLDVSYNELFGPIPRSSVLEKMNAINFEHNACLCGAPLPPCDYPVPPYDAPSPSPMY